MAPARNHFHFSHKCYNKTTLNKTSFEDLLYVILNKNGHNRLTLKVNTGLGPDFDNKITFERSSVKSKPYVGSSPNLKYKWGDMNCKKPWVFRYLDFCSSSGPVLLMNLWADNWMCWCQSVFNYKLGIINLSLGIINLSQWMAMKIKWEYTKESRCMGSTKKLLLLLLIL